MKSPLIAAVALALAAAALTTALLLPGSSNKTESAPTRTAIEKSNSATTSSGQLPYHPPNPKPDIAPTVLKAETLRLLEAVPLEIQASLIIDEPELKETDLKRVSGMVWIPGATFVMGNNHGPPDEAPRHAVALDGFWIDKTEVTNAQFTAFVDATGYVTLPEKKPELRSLREGSDIEKLAILEEMNQPGSICSLPISSRDEIDGRGAYSWWQYLPGANWRHPEGPDSTISDRLDHPVVHLSWLDVQEFCKWANTKLPTEAQWEYAARGGHDGRVYPWGNTQQPNGEWLQNIWQGEFPVEDTGEDGHTSTAAVGSFTPNDFGLYDMSGNVWEWCFDYYRPDYYFTSTIHNPTGPDESWDPQEPDIIKRVQRGGSFMCSDQYCIGYRVAARMKGEVDTGAFHTGFRTIITPDMINAQHE